MLISEGTLDCLVREALMLEARQAPGKVKTRKGYEVDWGSKRHIADLEASLNELIRIRNAQKRGSRTRYVYARAVEQMRAQYRSARRYGIKHGLIEEEL